MLREWLNGLGVRSPFPAVDPESAFSAIGDIHGRADLLERALNTLKERQIICVGDYVDRGDDSAGVLRLLHARPNIVCLSGNHEEMMLNFIDEPEEYGNHWLRFGGVQTLASFGVFGVHEGSESAAMKLARDALIEAFEAPVLSWLRTLPTYWQSGNVAVVHAGADPNQPINEQGTETLHWGHANFGRKQRTDGVWVLHGHTIVDAPRVEDGMVAIDTGAFFTGRLTIAHVDRDGVFFETIS